MNKRIYKAWCHIKDRCYNQNCKDYANYGERGITVCDEWINNSQAFYNWAINNGYESNLTLDRIDVNGNYSPDNCRWVDRKQQARNRRNTIYITYKGETMSLPDWCDRLNLRYDTIKRRYYRGWTVARMFNKNNEIEA